MKYEAFIYYIHSSYHSPWKQQTPADGHYCISELKNKHICIQTYKHVYISFEYVFEIIFN